MPKVSTDSCPASAQRRRANLLSAVFDQLSDGLVLYHPDLIIRGANKAAENLFGMTAEEMVGQHCRDVFRCGVCEPGCGMLIGLNRSQSAPSSTVRLHTAGGRERLAVIRTSQLHSEDGRLEGVVATVKDVTEEAAPQREVVPNRRPCARS